MRFSLQIWHVVCLGSVVALTGCGSNLPAVAIGGLQKNAAKAVCCAESACETSSDETAEPPSEETEVTADAALKTVLDGLRDNHPEVVWDALPASYQQDLNELLHASVERVPAELWTTWFEFLRESNAELKEASGDLTDPKKSSLPPPPDHGDGRVDEDQQLAVSLTRNFIKVTELLAADEIADLEKLKAADGRTLLSSTGQPLFHEIREMVDISLHRSGRPSINDLTQIPVSLQKSSGDFALVRMEFLTGPVDRTFIRVEGKWIPAWLAESWPQTMHSLKAALPAKVTAESANTFFGHFANSVVINTDQLMMFLGLNTESALLPHGVFAVPDLLNGLMLMGDMIAGPATGEAEFPKELKELLEDKDKKIVVRCHAHEKLSDDSAADVELGKAVSTRLVANRINVVEAKDVDTRVAQNSDAGKPIEAPAGIQADFIIDIDLHSHSLHEEASSDQYRGRATAIISVVKIDEKSKGADMVWTRQLDVCFPMREPVSAEDCTLDEFKNRFLLSLSDEIARMFYDFTE